MNPPDPWRRETDKWWHRPFWTRDEERLWRRRSSDSWGVLDEGDSQPRL